MNFKQYLAEMDNEEPLLNFDDELYEFRVILDGDHGLDEALKNCAIDNEWEADVYRSIKNASIVEKTFQGKLSPQQIYTQYVERKKPFVLLCFESDEDKAYKGIINSSSYYRHPGYLGDGENIYHMNMRVLDPVITKLQPLGAGNEVLVNLINSTVYSLAQSVAKTNKDAMLEEYAAKGIDIKTWVVFD